MEKTSMKLLKEFAGGAGGAGGAVGSGAIAAYPNRLFSKPKMLRRRTKVGNLPVIKYHNESEDVFDLKESLLNNLLSEFTSAFNPADVQSKLNASEQRLNFQKNTVPFGVEDAEGNIVKVYVRAEQADDFENSVGVEIERNKDTPKDIAALLWDLKDRFDIVHVEYPEIAGDEEQEATAPGGAAPAGPTPGAPPAAGAPGALPGGAAGGPEAGGAPGAEGGLPDLGGEGGEGMGVPPGAEGGMMGGGEEASTLDKVIDMLKSDIEARKAQADAEKAKANAEEAKYAAQIANDKIRSEQEVLDAKGYYEKEKQSQNEAKKLALLAKYRHDTVRDIEDDRTAQGFQ